MLHWILYIAGGLVIYTLGHLVGWHAGWTYGFRECWNTEIRDKAVVHPEDANANRMPLVKESGQNSNMESGSETGTAPRV
jgi:hypothetical protein